MPSMHRFLSSDNGEIDERSIRGVEHANRPCLARVRHIDRAGHRGRAECRSRVRVVLLHNPNARRARGTITSLGYMLQQRYAEQLIALIRTNLRGKG